MVLLALRAYHLSDAKNVAAIMFNHQSCIVDCGSFSRAYHALDKGNLLLHAHQRLHRHRAVHQADAGVGGVAVDTSVGEGSVFVAAELQDGVVHLIEETNYRQLF